MLQHSDNAKYRALVLLRTRPVLPNLFLFGMIEFARKRGVRNRLSNV